MGRVGDWVVAVNARDWIHAHLVAGFLADAGLVARVGNEHLQVVLGDVPSDLSTRPQVLVHARDLAFARELLADLERGSDADEWLEEH